MSEKISHYENEVAEEMQKQRSYFEENIYKMMKAHRNQINVRRERLNLKKKEFESLLVQEKELVQEN